MFLSRAPSPQVRKGTCFLSFYFYLFGHSLLLTENHWNDGSSAAHRVPARSSKDLPLLTLASVCIIETVMFCNYCKCLLNPPPPHRYSAACIHHYALSAVLGFLSCIYRVYSGPEPCGSKKFKYHIVYKVQSNHHRYPYSRHFVVFVAIYIYFRTTVFNLPSSNFAHRFIEPYYNPQKHPNTLSQF